MNNLRKSGFYWVLIKSGQLTEWYVCQYDDISRLWNFKGCAYPDESFINIDERKIERNKEDKP